METNRLKQLIVIQQTSNLRHASDLLHITHSALSKSMKQLENELGQGELFAREGRGIILTKFGHSVAEKAKIVLQTVDHLTATTTIKTHRSLTIASFEVFSTYAAAAVIKNMQEWDFNLVEVTPGQIETCILEGRADFGLTYEPVPMAGVSFKRIGRISMNVFGTKKIFNKKTALLDLPFAAPIIPLFGSPSGAKGLDGWNDIKFPRRIKYKVELLETALALCRAGVAVVCAPEFLIALHNQSHNSEYPLVAFPGNLPLKITRDIYLVQSAGESENAGVKKFISQLKQLTIV